MGDVEHGCGSSPLVKQRGELNEGPSAIADIINYENFPTLYIIMKGGRGDGTRSGIPNFSGAENIWKD